MRFIPLDRVGELEQALAAEIAGGTLTRRRDAIGTTLGLHGLRIGEVSRAMAEDFSPASRSIHVRTLKGGKPRDLPLHPTLVEALVAWRCEMGLAPSNGPLLPTRQGRPTAETQFRRYGCGLMLRLFGEKFKFHALRHTFAMKVLTNPEHPRDVMLVKKFLGHRSLDSTAQYIEALDQLGESCLVNLHNPFTLDRYPGGQLRLFTPAESG